MHTSSCLAGRVERQSTFTWLACGHEMPGLSEAAAIPAGSAGVSVAFASHSDRSAAIASARAARCVGVSQATRPRPTTTATRASGSVGVTCNRRSPVNGITARDKISPVPISGRMSKRSIGKLARSRRGVFFVSFSQPSASGPPRRCGNRCAAPTASHAAPAWTWLGC